MPGPSDTLIEQYKALRKGNLFVGRPRTGRVKWRVYRRGSNPRKLPPCVLRWPDHDGRYHYESFPSEQAAQERLAELLGKGLVGQRPAGGCTFAQYAETFLAERAASDIRVSTLREDKRRLTHDLIPVFGEYDLRAITFELVQAYKERRLADVKPGTWNRERALLSALFTSAYRRDLIDKHPIRGLIPASKEPIPDLEVFTEPEQVALLDACQRLDENKARPFLHAFCLIVFDTAARPGREVLTLRWSDVNFSTGQITFRATKSGKDRTVVLTLRLAAVLRARYDARRNDTWVFPGRDGQKPLSNYKGMYREALGMANLVYRRPFAMRHTALTNFAVRTGNPKDVQAFAGHSSLSVTQRYLHASRAVEQKAADVLGQIGEPVRKDKLRTKVRTEDGAGAG